MSKNASNVKPEVVCIHIGARAHYLIPKALQQKGSLRLLITDTWVSASWCRRLLKAVPLRMLKSLSGRYSSSIPSGNVRAFGIRFLWKECVMRIRYKNGWPLILARNKEFEAMAIKEMVDQETASTILGICYTSHKAFQWAKEKKLRTLLYQMDPGIEEEYVVDELTRSYGLSTSWSKAPESYWKCWRQECDMADHILVNSFWSRSALLKQGIPESKIHIIPLPYETGERHERFVRTYPPVFSDQRPLRCLFLGTRSLRKGIHLVIEAARVLVASPVQFILVGESELPEAAYEVPNITVAGTVTREQTDEYYQAADVFLFPTFSDGFGLTQLEAMAWKLPVIATDRCGEVVTDRVNGWKMAQPTARELIEKIRMLLAEPALLAHASSECMHTVQQFSLERFANDLSDLL